MTLRVRVSRDAAFRLALLLGVAAAFGQVAGFGFLSWDDPAYVTENPRVLGGLSGEAFAWAFQTRHYGLWHPLAWLSHQADVSLFGSWAGGHHLVSVAIHAAGALLLHAFLREAGLTRLQAGFVAVLFCLHPLRADSVAWVAERKDVLCVAALLLCLWSYGRWRRGGGLAYAILAHLACLLAALAKPLAVVAPLLLLIADHWPLARQDGWGRRLGEKAGYLLIALFVAGIALAGSGDSGASPAGGRDRFDLWTRVCLAADATWMLAWKTFWPSGLSFYHPVDWNGLPAAGARGLAFLGALLALAAWQWQRRPWLAAGIAWYLVALAPSSGIIQISGYAYADRYAYLPSIGLALAVAGGLPPWPAAARHRQVATAALAAAALMLILLTAREVSFWRDSETLYRRAIAVDPGNRFAHLKLSDHYFHAGRLAEAETHALLAQSQEEGVWYQFQLQRHLGQIAMRRGNHPAAREYWQQAEALRPGQPTIAYHFGLLALAEGNGAEAARHFGAALTRLPDNGIVWAKLGKAHVLAGDLPRARQAYEQSLRLDRRDAAVFMELAAVLEALGLAQEAQALRTQMPRPRGPG